MSAYEHLFFISRSWQHSRRRKDTVYEIVVGNQKSHRHFYQSIKLLPKSHITQNRTYRTQKIMLTEYLGYSHKRWFRNKDVGSFPWDSFLCYCSLITWNWQTTCYALMVMKHKIFWIDMKNGSKTNSLKEFVFYTSYFSRNTF